VKLIIDIPEEIYESQRYAQYFGAWSVVLQKHFENGIPIPDNATNGDVMMLVFDSRYKDEYTSFVHLEVGNGYFIPIPKGWWNAPYDGSDKE